MSQLGMMVIAIGLSSYNVALFHLINHAFYKVLLFLGAGAVIHAVADNQDFRKYGGLIAYLPLTYSVMLIASLSLVAIPFMTGFYSKDFILESAYGQYYLSSIIVYFIATIGAMFTTLYSVKVLYLTFLTNHNVSLINYKKLFYDNDSYFYICFLLIKRFLIELLYNKYISNIILKLGGQTTKVMDKCSIELFGPYGLEKKLTNLSKFIGNLSTGVVTSYALYILIGLIFYISILYYGIRPDIYLELLLILFGFIHLKQIDKIIYNKN